MRVFDFPKEKFRKYYFKISDVLRHAILEGVLLLYWRGFFFGKCCGLSETQEYISIFFFKI